MTLTLLKSETLIVNSFSGEINFFLPFVFSLFFVSFSLSVVTAFFSFTVGNRSPVLREPDSYETMESRG